MKKRNFYILLLLISIIIISAAATYSLQMFHFYENNGTESSSLLNDFLPGERFVSALGKSNFWQALQTFVSRRLRPRFNLTTRDEDDNLSDITETASDTDNFVTVNSPRAQNQVNIKDSLAYNHYRDYYSFPLPADIIPDIKLEAGDDDRSQEKETEKDGEIDGEELAEAVDEDAMGAGADSQFVDRIKSQLERYPEHFFIRSFSAERKVALTFDDGPGPHTERILDILSEYEVQATFFVLGFQVENFPGLLTRIVRDGHQVANHSYSHSDFSELPLAEVKREIELTNQLIKRETGFEPELIRPPYGRITDEQLENLIAEGYKFINWSVDSLDWDEEVNDHQIMMSRIDNTVHPGAIILLHDAGGDRSETEKLLPKLIKSLQERGYDFVTVDELLFH